MAELTTIARPYAKAAFEFALKEGKLAEWSNMLSVAAQVAADKPMQQVLKNPALTAAQKAQAFIDVCAATLDEPGKNFIAALSENARLTLFPLIAEIFEALKAEQEKTVEVNVTSAFELSDEQQKVLAQALRKRLNREIAIQSEVDKYLLGGVVIRAGDLVIDGSVRGKLAKLAESMSS